MDEESLFRLLPFFIYKILICHYILEDSMQNNCFLKIKNKQKITLYK